MAVLLQISDPHFGTELPEVLAALNRWVAEQRPDVMLWSGDITQRARREQFAAARRFANALAVPHLLAIPGNHDIPLYNMAARLFRPYHNYMQSFGEVLEPEFSSEELLIIGVKTTRRWRHKHGQVSHEQIDRVVQRLQRAQSRQLRVVMTHQPLHVLTEREINNRLRGADAAITAWAEAGADLVLGGHIHLPYCRKLDSAARPLWIVQAGTALSSRVRSGIPNSVNLIRYDPAVTPLQCNIERWDFDATRQCFSLIERTQAMLER